MATAFTGTVQEGLKNSRTKYQSFYVVKRIAVCTCINNCISTVTKVICVGEKKNFVCKCFATNNISINIVISEI